MYKPGFPSAGTKPASQSLRSSGKSHKYQIYAKQDKYQIYGTSEKYPGKSTPPFALTVTKPSEKVVLCESKIKCFYWRKSSPKASCQTDHKTFQSWS